MKSAARFECQALLLLALGLAPVASTRLPAADLDAALLRAAESGDLPAAKRLLAQGAAVDARYVTNGWTPLIIAANRGDLEFVRTLVLAGADINTQSSTPTGSRVLCFAVASGNLPLVELLVNKGVRIDAPSRDGSTALYHAAIRRQFEAAKYLLGRGADPNLLGFRDEEGRLFSPFLGAIMAGDTNMANLLLQHGATLEKRNNRGNTALMEMAKLDDSAALRWLLTHGAQVNTRGHHGHTAFIYAAYNGRCENLKLLLEAGADPLATACDQEEPDFGPPYDAATVARQQGHLEALAIVLEAQNRAKSKP